MGDRVKRWILRRAIERLLKGEAMDKLLSIIPKGKGTKFVGWAGVGIAALSLVSDAVGVTVPGVALTHGEAIQTIVGCLMGLYIRRKLDG